MFCLGVFGATWDIPGYGTINVPDSIAEIATGMGYTPASIAEALTDAGVTQEEFIYHTDEIETSLTQFSNEFENNPEFAEVTGMYNAFQDGFNDLGDNLISAMMDSSTFQNIDSLSYIGSFLPGFHFRLGLDASFATLDVQPLLNTSEILGMDFSIGDYIGEYLNDIPILNQYTHHLVFPTIALSARIGGIYLPFDAGFSFVKLDTRSEEFAQIPLPNGFNADYFVIGADLRYAFIDTPVFGISSCFELHQAKGNLELSLEQGEIGFNFESLTSAVGVQSHFTLFVADLFIGAKLNANLKSNTKLAISPNWDIIMNVGESNASMMNALLPREIGFETPGNFQYGTMIYGGISLNLFCIRATATAGYNFITKNLLANINLKISF